MNESPPRWSDEWIEQTVGDLLRFGLLFSTAVVVIGGAIYLARHGSEPTVYQIFHGEPPDLRGIAGIIAVTLDWRGRGFVQLGLLFLLATPVCRVVFSLVAFSKQGDWMYVAITGLVLAVLLYGIVGGYV